MNDNKLSDGELEIFKMLGYSERAIYYILENVNLGILKNPDIKHINVGECGDLLYLYINLRKNGKITDAQFRYAGCAALAASGSSMTELAKGKTIRESLLLTDKDIMNDLVTLPEDHMHCPKLAIDTLRGAIKPILDSKLLTKEDHNNYKHFCGLTGNQLDALSSIPCKDCDQVDACEVDHIIINNECGNP
jgi:nitrogen fixation NifU-like protein